jgi:hypothetical protein
VREGERLMGALWILRGGGRGKVELREVVEGRGGVKLCER